MKIRLSLFTLFLVFYANQVYATDYYVNAATGSNISGNGGSGTPWKTITYALGQINGTGHTLFIASGTYNVDLGETFPIIMEDGVSLIGAGATTCIIDAGGTNSVIKCIGIVYPGTHVEGITFRKGGNVTHGSGFYISAGSVLIIQNNIITLNNADGLYVENSSPLIRNNRILNNAYTPGIHTSGLSSSPRIINNVITGNSDGIECTNFSQPEIINNTFSGNSYGIYISGAQPDSVFNNIFAFQSGWGIYEYNSLSDPNKLYYNLFYANNVGLYYNEGTTSIFTATDLNTVVTECKNNFSGDPLFIDRSVDNYHERSGSASIDAGDPASDYSLEPYPAGGIINVGAYGNTSEAALSNSPPIFSFELYVDANLGSNITGDGSQMKPWKTITFALNQLPVSNHELHVAPGIYNQSLGESFPIYMKDGISIIGAGIDNSILDAEKIESVICCLSITDSNTRIEGFTIKNGTYPGVGGIKVGSGSNLKITRNKVIRCGGNTAYNLTMAGINISNSSPEISGNTFSDNEGSAIYVSNGSPSIKFNIISGNSGNSYRGGGITVTGSSSSPLISNNEIIKNSLEGIRCNGSSTPIIINNTISENSTCGIQMGGFAESGGVPEIVNNIISHNTQYGIYEYTTAGDPSKVWYNLFYFNGSGLYHDEAATDYFTVSELNSSVVECKNNLSGDPLFVDKTNFNYHILSGSPAINAGDPASPLDPDGSLADIGAYYYIPPPDSPVALDATSITQSGFQSNWNASAGATGYYLDVAKDAGFTVFFSGFNNKNVQNVTTYLITGLTANTQYFCRIRAYNATGTSTSSNVISVATLQIPAPITPTAISASGITQTSFYSNWNASATATGYYLDVATDNTFTSFVTGYNNKALANVITSPVSGLSPNTTYYFRVRAFNEGGTSASSNIISLTTLQIPPPTAPTATPPTEITQTSFTAKWNASGTATGYYLDVATDGGFINLLESYTNYNAGNVTTLPVTGLLPNTSYYYRVRAYNAGGTSSNSIIISTVTLALLPAVPTANDPTNIVQRSFTANWSSATNASGYYLDVSTNSSFTTFITGFNNKDVLNVLSLNIAGLFPGTTYYYRVRAYSTGGTSENSNTITAKTLSIPVSDHYVNVTTGNNSTGDGSVSKPWKTITYALEHSSGAGRHAINVSAGTYNPASGEIFPLMIPDSISLIGAGKDVTIINANSTNYVIQGTGILDSQSRLEGFTISGGRSSGPGGIYLSAGSALRIANNLITLNYADGNASGGAIHIVNSSPRIEMNTITSNHGVDINKGATIYITGTTSAPAILDNIISYNANDLDGGGGVIGAGTIVVMSSSGTIIHNNIIIGNNPGYYNEGGTVYMNSCSPSVKNNVIAKNNGNGICVFYSTSSPSIINNTISDNTYDGIYLYAGTPDSIFNNIISFNSAYGIREYSTGGDPAKVWYNLFYQNGTGLYFDEASTAITSVTTLNASVAECKNNLTGNPMFNDKTNNNYRLTSGSAAIDAGDPAGPLDPDNTIADIGAYYLIPAPPAPVAASATSITYSSFQANWNESSTATGYYLDIATDEGFTVFLSGFNNKDVANITTLAITGLSQNKTYYYRVRAYNADGPSASSNVITLTTEQIPAPLPPIANAASNIGQTDFTANWSITATATGYYLDIATDNAFTSFVNGYNSKDVLNVINYSITGLTANTSYYYRIRAYNAGGTSSSSNTIILTTLLNPPEPPSAPIAIAATNITKTSFTANWNSVTGASGYRLDVATDNSFTSFVTGYNNKEITNSTSDSVGGLSLSTNYYYRLRATNSGVASSSSNTISVTTLSNPPASPVCTSASSVTQYTFTANWNTSATASGYRLDVSTESSFITFVSGYDNKDVGNVTNSSVTGLSLNTVYYYRVRAYNSGGTSSNSNTISITTLLNAPTLPSAPTALSAVGITQTDFTARWSSSSTSTGYYIDVSSNSSFTTLLSGYSNKFVGNVTSITVTGLTQKNYYFYRVRATNTYGTSGNSNSITVTTLPNPPSAPSGLTAVSCNDQVTLTWTANTETDFLRYRIYGGTSANPTTKIDSTATGSISAVTKILSGLTHGQTYYFRITAVVSPGVASSFSSSVSLIVKKGVIPKIKGKFNKVLICYNTGDSISGWQWYNGTTAISGATKQYYVIEQPSGSYSVTTTDKNGCKNSSNIINITGTKSISVYPNPANNQFELNYSSQTFGRTLITLYNSSGTKVLEYQKDKPDEVLKCEIPVDNLFDGIYTIKVLVNEEELSFSRVVIIN
jgi:parallel beta-helix repeat protein